MLIEQTDLYNQPIQLGSYYTYIKHLFNLQENFIRLEAVIGVATRIEGGKIWIENCYTKEFDKSKLAKCEDHLCNSNYLIPFDTSKLKPNSTFN